MIAEKRAQIVAGQRLGGAARRRDAMVVELEDVAQVVPRVRVVLDHQDVDRRRALSMSSVRAVAGLLLTRPGPVAPASSSSSGTSNGL